MFGQVRRREVLYFFHGAAKSILTSFVSLESICCNFLSFIVSRRYSLVFFSHNLHINMLTEKNKIEIKLQK